MAGRGGAGITVGVAAAAILVAAIGFGLDRAHGSDGFDSALALPDGPGGWWTPVFAEEFDGSTLDGRRWHTCFWWASETCSIASNDELELYREDGVVVANGIARLGAQRHDVAGWNGTTYPYSSGMVSTGGRKYERPPGFTFTYGFAEARVRVPRGTGLWPAFWLLPASYASRPEIDVMEILGDSTDVNHMHVHYLEPDGTKGDAGADWRGPDFAAGWHTFGVDWEPGEIVWYVDGVERWRVTDPAAIPSEPMYVLANLAVGGDWPGSPDATTPFPSSYDIDYVRVWQRAAAPVSTTDLVSSDASWRYLDDGSDQGVAWRANEYDATGWNIGPATLGYGQGDERTVVGFGPDPARKVVTTYFRRSFGLADAGAVTSLVVKLRQDDGAIVYLNGTEVFRSNMPAGEVGSATRALEAGDDGTLVRSASVDPSLLRAGRNTVAVEVHQATAASSDLTMQLALEAMTG
ncbi:MAG TPA: glycoside hydrolase family 16 protein [Gaiellaceae bacterium]